MKKIIGILIVGLLLFGCKEKTSEKREIKEKLEFNQELANELKKMAEIDQIAAYIPQGEYKKMTDMQWNSYKDSVFTTHEMRLKQIFKQYGFVGFDLAGKEGSQNFWLMIQHSDHNPDFQKEVLEKMKIEVDKGNAKPSNYGLLVDRVMLNIGKQQVYGTQVDYNMETGQAFPRNLKDSSEVNKKRKSIGLEPIEEYLNGMSEMHFEMNKEGYIKKGITEPKLYKIE
ncbi:hypothetical protein PXC01_04150 [Maribacter sp. M208]|uniref:DUF6624 domain-containing protein n=1 Tax=Maribacter huludaoensis TaxID=3030010 RepID=UPI0023EBEE59|nr:DUF6624 domain-containing protein [Maribacter huludaoensis]MDF4220768.1 hypothetical protein [Maribacter huludaoensis]